MSESLDNTLYIITGTSGFLGLEIARLLCEEGCLVHGLVRGRNTSTPYPSQMVQINADILDRESLENLYVNSENKKTVVIHSAGYISVKRKNKLCEKVNIEGCKNILDICKKYNSRLIYISSVDALTNCDDIICEPSSFELNDKVNSYAKSKAIASQMVLDSLKEGLEGSILIPSAIAGPNDYKKGFIDSMLSLYLSGISWFSIKGGYDFVDVRDVALASVNSAKGMGSKHLYILSNQYASVRDIYNILADYVGIKRPFLHFPLWTLYIFIPFMELRGLFTKKESPLSTCAIKLLGFIPNYSNQQAKKDLNFKPRPLKETFEDAADFMLERKKN